MQRDDVLTGVRECLAEVLELSADAIPEDAVIVGDLGADSLDLLDLSFHLEQRFRIRISPRDSERRTKERLGDIPLEVDGVYTPEALAQLREAMPEVPPTELADGLTTAELPRRFRVATMVGLVLRLLAEQAEGQGEASDG